MVKISNEAKAIVALEEEIDALQSEAVVLNAQVSKLREEFLKQLRELSDKHELVLVKIIQCEKAIHETKKLLCKGGNSY